MTESTEQLSPADAVRATAGAIPGDPDELVKEKRAAEILDVSPRTLQSWRLRGVGPPFVRLSARAIRYGLRGLAAHVAARTVRSTSDPGAGDSAPAPAEG